jgi:hypothetical protein
MIDAIRQFLQAAKVACYVVAQLQRPQRGENLQKCLGFASKQNE